MKIERINENQIRCTLTNFDLSMRNLHVNDLAYGTDKTGNLFHEMMERASSEVGFEAEDTPLMVEAIPMANESVMLIITKLDDPEELDTRFSKFSQMVEDEEPAFASFPTELLEGADKLLNFLGSQDPLNLQDLLNAAESAESAKSAGAKPTEKTENCMPAAPTNAPSLMRIYVFDNLDLVCSAAKRTGPTFNGSGALYKNPSNGKFYLVLKKEDSDELAFHRTCNILSEYGSQQKYDAAVEAYYSEHFELFVRENALKALSVV